MRGVCRSWWFVSEGRLIMNGKVLNAPRWAIGIWRLLQTVIWDLLFHGDCGFRAPWKWSLWQMDVWYIEKIKVAFLWIYLKLIGQHCHIKRGVLLADLFEPPFLFCRLLYKSYIGSRRAYVNYTYPGTFYYFLYISKLFLWKSILKACTRGFLRRSDWCHCWTVNFLHLLMHIDTILPMRKGLI